MKKSARVTQQKGRRISIQLQEQDDREINNFLEKGHSERVDTIKDDVFIQPVVVKRMGQFKWPWLREL